MVDWEEASRQSDFRLWRAMFWIHIVLLALGIVSLLFVIVGNSGRPSLGALVPGISLVVVMVIFLPNAFRKWRSSR